MQCDDTSQSRNQQLPLLRVLQGFEKVQHFQDETPCLKDALFIWLRLHTYVSKHFLQWYWTRADWGPDSNSSVQSFLASLFPLGELFSKSKCCKWMSCTFTCQVCHDKPRCSQMYRLTWGNPRIWEGMGRRCAWLSPGVRGSLFHLLSCQPGRHR